MATTVRHRRSHAPLAAAAAVLALLLVGCGGHAGGAHGSAAMGVTGEGRAADLSFAQLMIPHHEQAVEMADLALARDAGPQVTALAEDIKAAQGPEIAQMRGWLSAWGGAEAGGHSGADHSGMPGMMSDEEMQRLAEATGAEFDRLWLQMMIAHHEGAVTMARQVLAVTDDAQVRGLADAVVRSQTTEIAGMRELLAG